MRTAELQLWEEARELWLRSVFGVAILFLNLGDLITTQMSLSRGGVEINPLSRWLIDNGILAPTKIGLAAFIVVAALAASSRRRHSSALAAVAGIYVAVVSVNSLQLLFL